MENFDTFRWNISSSINLFFLKSGYTYLLLGCHGYGLTDFQHTTQVMSSARRKWVQILAICTPILVLYSFTARFVVQDENHLRLPPPKLISKNIITDNNASLSTQFLPTSELCSTTNITIIPWNSYWIWPDYGIGIQNTGFLEHNCSCTNCFLSLDKSKIDKADVILIHGHELGGIKKEELINLKKRRISKNGWPLILYWNKESPK